MKILLSGAALSLAAGVALGGAMQPQLDAGGDRPAGPQMFADWAGDRSTGPFDPGTTFLSYSGKIPDYVMGTDWKRRMAWPEERAEVPAGHDSATDQAEADATLTPATYDEPAPPTHEYPSMEGANPSVTEIAPADDPAPDPASGD